MDYLYRLGHRHVASSLGRWSARSAMIFTRRDRAPAAEGRYHFVVMNGDFSIESGAVGAGSCSTQGAADRDLLLQRRDGDGRWRRPSAAAARAARRPIVGFDDIRFARASIRR
jgi:hypothetical protein